MNILLDMDGVLCDFVTGSLKAHNRTESHDDIKTWGYYEEWGMSDKEFWAPLDGHEFWENLDPYPWAIDFYKELTKLGDVTISTSPNADVNCIIGKYRWGQKHLGLKVKDFMVGGKKHLLANKNSVLIDDYHVNVINFMRNGGNAILFRQPWNKASYVSYDALGCLNVLKNGNN